MKKIANISNYNAVIQILFNFWVFREILFDIIISSKKLVIEPTAGMSEAKTSPQNCQKLQIFLFSTQWFKYYGIIQHIFMSSGKTDLSTIRSSQKVAIELEAERGKILSKINLKTHMFIFKIPRLLHLSTYLPVFLT